MGKIVNTFKAVAKTLLLIVKDLLVGTVRAAVRLVRKLITRRSR